MTTVLFKLHLVQNKFYTHFVKNVLLVLYEFYCCLVNQQVGNFTASEHFCSTCKDLVPLSDPFSMVNKKVSAYQTRQNPQLGSKSNFSSLSSERQTAISLEKNVAFL